MFTSFFSDKNNTFSIRSLNVDPNRENKMFRYAIEDDIAIRSKLLRPEHGEVQFDAVFKYAFSTKGLDGFIYFVYSIAGKPVSPSMF